MKLFFIIFLILQVSLSAGQLESFEGSSLYEYFFQNRKTQEDVIPFFEDLIYRNKTLKNKVKVHEKSKKIDSKSYLDSLIFELQDESLLPKVQSYLDKIDVKKGAISAKVIQLQYANAEMVALQLRSIFGLVKESFTPMGVLKKQTIYDKDLRIVADRSSNSLVLDGVYHQLEKAEKLIRSMDNRTAQVLIEVLITEVTLNEDSSLGIEWGTNGTGIGGAKIQNTGKVDFGTVNGTVAAASNRSALQGLKFAILNPGKFEVFMQNFQQLNSIKVISRPKILTSNNQKARFKASQRNPVLRTTNADGVVNNAVDYIDIGVDLLVTPRINRDNYISLSIVQSIQEILGTDPNALNSPIYSERLVDSEVLVKDNHTLVLGGIISSASAERISRIPLLSKIPFIKHLAKRKIKDTKTTEMMIFLTPHIVRDHNSADEITSVLTKRTKSQKVINQFINMSKEYKSEEFSSQSVIGLIANVTSGGKSVLINAHDDDWMAIGDSFEVVRSKKELINEHTNQVMGHDFKYIAHATVIGKHADGLYYARVQSEEDFGKVAIGDFVRKSSSYFFNGNARTKIKKMYAQIQTSKLKKNGLNSMIKVRFDAKNIDTKTLSEFTLSDGVFSKDTKFFNPILKKRLKATIINKSQINASTKDSWTKVTYKVELDQKISSQKDFAVSYETPMPKNWVKRMKKEKRFELNSTNPIDATYDIEYETGIELERIEPDPVYTFERDGFTVLRYFKPKEKFRMKLLHELKSRD